jgi:cytoskeletal protein RodZ
MFGEILREKRIESGMGLKETADILRIRYEYLKALEEDEFAKLPPDVYTNGYIRAYSKLLGIDPEPLIKAYMEKKLPPAVEIQPAFPPPQKRYAFTGNLLFIALAMIIVAIIVLTMAVPKKNKAANSSAALPAAAKTGSQSQTGQKQYLLDVTAIETTWLRIEFNDGKSEEALMRPGDSKKWSSQKGFDLKIGNAGGVKLVLNGKDLGAPGAKGQVLKLRLPKDETSKPSVADNR